MLLFRFVRTNRYTFSLGGLSGSTQCRSMFRTIASICLLVLEPGWPIFDHEHQPWCSCGKTWSTRKLILHVGNSLCSEQKSQGCPGSKTKKFPRPCPSDAEQKLNGKNNGASEWPYPFHEYLTDSQQGIWVIRYPPSAYSLFVGTVSLVSHVP